jgi:hypothetical protein
MSNPYGNLEPLDDDEDLTLTQWEEACPEDDPRQTAACRAARVITFASGITAHRTAPVAQRRRAVEALINLCVRTVQCESISKSILRGHDCVQEDPLTDLLGLQFAAENSEWTEGPISASGLIWTFPWQPERLARALMRFGNEWREPTWRSCDDRTAYVLLPWRIGVVDNGNHSIASGVLWGDGWLEPLWSLDFSDRLRAVQLGETGLESLDGQLIGSSDSWAVLALIGLGRLLLELIDQSP